MSCGDICFTFYQKNLKKKKKDMVLFISERKIPNKKIKVNLKDEEKRNE